jgi:Pyridoxal-dependent decarboxylase, pyridoxal binding domain
VRRCAAYRRALRGAAVNVPATLLRHPPIADWARRCGVGVDAAGAEQLDVVRAAGLPTVRVAAQCADRGAVESAVEAGVGLFVVDDAAQVALLDRHGTRRLMIDVTDRPLASIAEAVRSLPELEVIGLQRRLSDSDVAAAADQLRAMVVQMAWLRREHGLMLTRACLTDFEADGEDASRLRRCAEILQGTVEEACARLRYPRPALVLSLRGSALL